LDKKGFYIGRDILETVDTHWLNGPNVWPKELESSVFKDPFLKYYDYLYPLCMTILSILARGMPYGPHVFDQFTQEPCVAVMRPLHYPPQPPSSPKDQLGAGAHTDFGAITLLLTDSHAGLEVFDYTTDRWVGVEPNPEAYIVNIGDMIHRWTNGEYKSNLHRVRNLGAEDRYSIPFFFDGNMDTLLKPFDGSAPFDGKVITADEHMRERFQSTSIDGTS
jgi:isopenicillin N synthase-like dioxygenase